MTKETVGAPSLFKRLLPAALLVAGLAAPLATAGTAEARGGCGLGGHRGPYGFCRPNLGPRVFYRPYGYRPAFYGPRRFGWGGPRWHRWGGGYGRVGWHGGWHRRW
ncbi:MULTISPECIES: hypothetical protein [unclassified Methylobacterium]|uniref:GCG_CRPN prefix-to-repeats domain-containing protein n=1 Tax=unclassified Methylobacterium TaxID=2615210 RepID=UPI001FEF5EF6|nr:MULTISPECIES: hypothetical protein [unclassified Methylobacterium]